VLNIAPRLPLKLRGAKCLDLQGANLATVVADTRDYKGEAKELVMKARAEGGELDTGKIEELTSMHTLRMCCIPLLEKLNVVWRDLRLKRAA
ncbi:MULTISPECIES: hypothetical protein, partial [unclassified Aeromonas]|uniref:hypothetical protein n=1 Tax=unclassified Aeromonas TaxID=257493 RepID=UPI0022E41875